MFLLVRNADLYDPAHRGRRDILVAGGKIVAIADRLDPAVLPGAVETLEAGGSALVPGLVDCHVHITGGGGEGGFSTRTPELGLSEASLAGVTTVIGLLGTDGIARGMEALVAKVYGLREEGLSAWCLTGSYRLPLRTVTGDAMKDIMMIEPVIGIGEVALSDHRSSQPSRNELARLASEARVAGMLSGKAGLLTVHLGDGPAGLAPLEEIVAAGEIPRSQFLPTHCGRNPRIYEEAIAWARKGGRVDFTTSGDSPQGAPGGISAARALLRLKREGIELSCISWSSDGQGSLPRFDAEGRLVGLAVGSSSSLLESLREAVFELGLPLETALLPLTANPSAAHKLPGKGRLEPGADADFLLLDAELRPSAVAARGRLLVKEGRALVRGTFERA